MSPEQPALVTEPAAVRRRIVATPQRTTPPVALIIRERGSLPALEEVLQRTRPVVYFPSLSHFCTDSQRSERWAGVIIARPCAWDARLDDYVVDRACMALYGDAEGYGWPESVQRLADDAGLDRWLSELDLPRVRTPIVRPRKKRVAEGTARRQRSVFTLWDPAKSVQVVETPAAEVVATPKRVTTVPPPVAKPKVTVAPVVTATRRARKSDAQQQSLPFVDVAKPAPVDTRELAHAALSSLLPPRKRQGTSPAASALTLSEQEERVARLSLELGFPRAHALLARLRERARELAR